MVLSRDFLLLLVALLLILAVGKRKFPPSWAGKVTTVVQIVTLLFVLCANVWDWPRPLLLVAFGATATATVISGFDYVFRVARESATPATASP
jgi:phosphatidylglycerophosphate synthase